MRTLNGFRKRKQIVQLHFGEKESAAAANVSQEDLVGQDSAAMANRTVKDAQTIKGTNPQYLVEKIIRTRIYDCKYWKEECFALTGQFVKNLLAHVN